MADQTKAINSNWRIYLICAALLVANCLWRVLVPGTEYGSVMSVWLGLIVDVLLLVGLIGLYRQFSAQMTADDSRRGLMQLAFWPGLVAGIVTLAIRFSSDHGWWTGHLRYVLE
jgi:hypothetical protein